MRHHFVRSTPLDFGLRDGVYRTYVPVRIVLILVMISDVRYGMHTGTVRYSTELRLGFLFYVYGMCGTGIAVQWSTYDVRYSVQHSVRIQVVLVLVLVLRSA